MGEQKLTRTSNSIAPAPSCFPQRPSPQVKGGTEPKKQQSQIGPIQDTEINSLQDVAGRLGIQMETRDADATLLLFASRLESAIFYKNLFGVPLPSNLKNTDGSRGQIRAVLNSDGGIDLELVTDEKILVVPLKDVTKRAGTVRSFKNSNGARDLELKSGQWR